MSGHRKRPKALTDLERDAILSTATAFHAALRRPRIDVRSTDYQATIRAHEAVCRLFHDLTGKDPPWAGPNTPPMIESDG